MLPYITAIMTSYVITLLISSSTIAKPFRDWFTKKIPKSVIYIGAKPFIECRLCVGFWVSLFLAFIYNLNFFIIYGISYFIATQER